MSRRTTAGLVLAVVATGAGTAVGATPAQSVTGTECPQTFPVASVTRGLPVTGKTVVSGAEPIGLTGTVLGVLDDGIAPGLDMVMVDLSGNPAVDDAGIWAGMSGSPIYDAASGRIIGAVAYGLALGDSAVAGVTPAGQMRRLLDRPAARHVAGATRVSVTPAQARTIAHATSATPRQAQGGFARLPVPFGVSGVSSKARLQRAVKKFGFDHAQVYRAGAASAPVASADPGHVVAGGNLAASLAYGDVTAAGVGTATMVCGLEVLAFGHPAFYSGPSSMTMHAAEAIHIQRDAFVSFKVANIGGPVGVVDRDRLAGLHGVLGSEAVPDTTRLTSQVRSGGRERTGTTLVSVPAAVPDIAATHLLVGQDRVFDQVGGGTALVTWRVDGLRQNGSPFRFTRTDRFADEGDVSFVPPMTLYSQLARVQANDFEETRITKVTSETVMSGTYRRWRIQKVQAKVFGAWVTVSRRNPAVTRPGRVLRLEVTLASHRNREGTRTVRLAVPVPKRADGPARLRIVGGDHGWYDEYFSEEMFGPSGPSAKSFDDVLHQIRTSPRNDQLRAELSVLRPKSGTVTVRRDKRQLGAVVGGSRTLRVLVLGKGR